MQGGYLAGIGEAESGTVVLLGLALVECFENEFAFFFRDSYSVVLDTDDGISVLLRNFAVNT